MAGIAGLPYFDSYWNYQKLLFLNSNIHHDLYFMHCCDGTLEEIRYYLFMIWYKLQVGACRSLINPLSRDWCCDCITSISLDGNRLTWSILSYSFLATHTYKLLKIELSLQWKHCDCNSTWGSVVYRWTGVTGNLHSRRAEAVLWCSHSETAAWLWSPNDRSYFRILEIGLKILLSQNPVKCGYL